MRLFRDALNERDRLHLRKVLGHEEDPTFSETRRRYKVNQLTMDDTFMADQALQPFQELPQEDREQLISDLVWRLTCHVEGSITKARGRGIKLEYGFRLHLMVQDGRPIFCVVKKK